MGSAWNASLNSTITDAYATAIIRYQEGSCEMVSAIRTIAKTFGFLVNGASKEDVD